MRWTLKPNPDETQVQALANALGVDLLLAQLLVQRNITSFEQAKNFFRPQLDQLHDPFLMKDMDKAVARIQKALAQGERIMVFGDYDVDGTTSVALMATYLLQYHPDVVTYIPDRYQEGYGVSLAGIDFADDNDISLIIALDCGVKAIDKVDYAATKGIDFIICDHHRPGDSLPNAVAVLDPKRDDCGYPYTELCGCGVGFKLIQALEISNGGNLENLIPYLDLVAIAIGADIVPITGENRILAYYGLQQINQAPRAGIRAMTHQLDKRELTITDVVFILAPRINAAGRMEHGMMAVSLLMETDFAAAMEKAAAVGMLNDGRKEEDKSITEEALKQIVALGEENAKTTVVYNPNWHKGVIGIVASRLTETYYRPTLVFTKSGDRLAASARSVKGFDVYNALSQCRDFIEQFGGHKYAAGLTLRENQYECFKKRFEEVVAQSITPEQLQPEITVDARMQLSQITPKMYRILKQFAPFGPGNMAPVFLGKHLCDSGYGKSVGENGKHLKLNLSQNGCPPIGAIGFNLGPKLKYIQDNSPIDAVFSLDENHWNNRTSLQLKLKDIRPSQ